MRRSAIWFFLALIWSFLLIRDLYARNWTLAVSVAIAVLGFLLAGIMIRRRDGRP